MGPTPAAEPETPATKAASSGQENPIDFFTRTDAERIMGEGMYLSDSSTTPQSEAWVYQSVFSATAKRDSKADVYYMFEQYSDSLTAHKVYAAIKKSNEKNGIETLQGMGDEAYYHTDGTNFCFLLVRKGNKMVRMKVNKLTEKTSREIFLEVGKRIISING